MLQSFGGRSIRDPGSRTLAWWCWAAALVLILVITTFQQMAVNEKSAPRSPVPTPAPIETEKEKAEKEAGAPSTPTRAAKLAPIGEDFDQVDLAGRLTVRLARVLPAKDAGQMSGYIEPHNQTAADAVRLVPAYTELAGKEAGLELIDELEDRVLDEEAADNTDAEATDRLLNDLLALRELYTNGSAQLSQKSRDRLTQRLRWQGELALTFDLPDTDPARKEILGNGAALAVLLVAVGGGFVLALLTGVVLAVIGLVMLSTGKLKPRLDRAEIGGSLGVEVLVVFLASFLGLQIVMELVVEAAKAGYLGSWAESQAADGLLPVRLVAQWVILPIVIFYPRLRGFSRPRIKRAMGWHRGEGLVKEIGCGIAGYLALLPAYLVAVLIALLLSTIEVAIRKEVTGNEPAGAVNPFAEMLSSHGLWVVLMLGLLATVWAPIVEESVFRGGMFRQLHARLGLVLAALLSGTVFAMMHGYSPSLFPPLIVLGSGFALIRWWRGSLVSCIAAHALHNGTITLISLGLFPLLS